MKEELKENKQNPADLGVKEKSFSLQCSVISKPRGHKRFLLTAVSVLSLGSLFVLSSCTASNGDKIDSSLTPTPASQFSIVKFEKWQITRVNETTFMVNDLGWMSGYGGLRTTNLSEGVKYMRLRECQIKSVDNLAANVIKVIVSNSTDCLPELK